MSDFSRLPNNWREAHPGAYERSFDAGKTWAPCGRRDVINAFGRLKAFKLRMEAGETIASQHGVLYRLAGSC